MSTAMHNKIGLAKLGAAIYPYPTYAESFRNMADEYTKRQVIPGQRSSAQWVIEMRR